MADDDRSKDLVIGEHWDVLDKVAKLYIKGSSVPTIAKQLRLRVKDVETYLNEFRYYVRHNEDIQDRARTSVHVADSHYSTIIEELWSVVEEAGMSGNLSAKNVALKNAADVEQKRVVMLAAAGAGDQNALAELMIENEKKIALVTELLRDLAKECPRCKPIIMSKLSKLSGHAEVIVVQEPEE